MRWIALAVVVLLPIAYAQQPAPNPSQKIEMTFSLNGAEMYKTWCAPCHGVDGKGDGPTAAALKTKPADLTELAKKNGGKFPMERVRAYIEGKDSKVTAHGTREMPVWGTVFSQLDASAVGIGYRVNVLAAYVESLQKK